MSLNIYIEDPRQYYAENDIIRGRIIFDCPRDFQQFKDVRLTFSGCSKAKIQKVKGPAGPTGSYQSKCILFKRERILVPAEECKIPPTTYEWPFEFHFPPHVESPNAWPEAESFRVDENQPLPPSFNTECHNSLRRVSASVEYRLKVQIFKLTKGLFERKSPIFEKVVHLPFVPMAARARTRAIELEKKQKIDRTFTVRSLSLLPGNTDRSLSVQERFKAWLSPGQLPYFSFGVEFRYPLYLVGGMPIPLLLGVKPLIDNSNAPQVPEIILQTASITLIGRTAARASPLLMGSMLGEVDEETMLLSKTSLRMAVSGQMDLSERFGQISLPTTDVTFNTFNLSRSYRLRISLVFECAGKLFKFDATDLEVGVLSNAGMTVKKDGLPRGSADEGSSHSRRYVVYSSDEQPPPYLPSSGVSEWSSEGKSSV
ncbi:uncharacterized protein NFIA_094660 [Aspergillus fischeri NRRL 181]|uniref:Arrestin-like N-terminal domain-containing protein n=1 Tax=Neosartorya fischeri (strain ATCC 1020 / DSM 3700 / CBS 544.65 / FGSC A1164 / JCM 1740 / NRRL 181 / WB 181) TaxID=331117 RepID=A1DAF6_NEOFI|nr:conserved hypothetical protein [Aspergillus fischeri NRRL 181]EAW19846.1 conserved hypothetical protein [Aspergillus fischeri NRRL 181]KAG2009379.1 hypothetical protein GB937_007782 [Aspergillus fischeri]